LEVSRAIIKDYSITTLHGLLKTKPYILKLIHHACSSKVLTLNRLRQIESILDFTHWQALHHKLNNNNYNIGWKQWNGSPDHYERQHQSTQKYQNCNLFMNNKVLWISLDYLRETSKSWNQAISWFYAKIGHDFSCQAANLHRMVCLVSRNVNVYLIYLTKTH